MTLLATQPKTRSAAIPSFPVCRMSVEEYHQFIEMGVYAEDDSIELLEGWVAPKMPQNPDHTLSLGLTNDSIDAVLPKKLWFLNVQTPVTTENSEPEPDLSVIRGRRRDYLGRRYGSADTGMLAEVADTSLEHDRTIKGRIYARAHFPVYWIINLPERMIEVYTQPGGGADDPRYLHRQDYRLGETVPLILDGMEIAQIPVKDLLP